MNHKWNLGDIHPPSREKRAPVAHPQSRPLSHRTQVEDMRRIVSRPHHVQDDPVPSADEDTVSSGTHGKRRRYSGIFAVALFVGIAVGVVYGFSVFFGGSNITVFPKFKEVTLDATFDAYLKPVLGQMSYELLSLTEEGERRVTATGQETVSERAEGTITISNTFSTAPQRLIKNTRFESPEGLIFRISDSVVVPGYTKAADGTVKAGSITAKVFADGVGEKYNLGSVRLSLPGLKGGEQFDKIVAESKGSFIGGFEGMKFIINEKELSATREALQIELRDKLLEKVKTARPNGFILYEPSITFEYVALPPTDAGDQTVIIKEQARLIAPLFEKDSFANRLAKEAIADFDGSPVKIDNPTALTFQYASSSATDIETKESLTFTLSGTTRIIWVFDAEKLRNDVKGLQKTALTQVLSGYPSIDTAKAVVRPAWSTSFPTNIEDITITEQSPESTP